MEPILTTSVKYIVESAISNIWKIMYGGEDPKYS